MVETAEAVEMEWAEIHGLYEENRIELCKAFAKKRNKRNELFSVESQKEAVEFLEAYLNQQRIKLKCNCLGRLAYMLVFSVDCLRLG